MNIGEEFDYGKIEGPGIHVRKFLEDGGLTNQPEVKVPVQAKVTVPTVILDSAVSDSTDSKNDSHRYRSKHFRILYLPVA